VPWMEQRLRNGYQPGAPMDGPNIWRLQRGDRVVWTGPARKNLQNRDGLIGVYDFRASALVVGMSDTDPNPLKWMRLDDSPESLESARAAVAAIQSLGIPRELDAGSGWRVG
jgi:hypothetical protein